MCATRQVLFNCNHLGVTPLSVAIYSLLKHADPSSPLGISVIHDTGFADLGGCEKIRDVVRRFPFASVRFVNFDPTYAKYADVLSSPYNAWTPMVWGWTFCADLLPDLTGNLVFIDWDMYVRHDLRELYELDLEGENLVSAAINESKREHRPELVAAGWPETAGYTVTTALQVINLDAFRRERVRERMFDWYASHKNVAICVEQDALNVVFGDRIKRLSPVFNCPVSWLARILKDDFSKPEWRVFKSEDVLRALADPAIIHFIGGNKPWKYNHRPWRNEYRKAMIELGIIRHDLPGETLVKKAIGAFFDIYHAILRRRVSALLRKRASQAPRTGI